MKKSTRRLLSITLALVLTVGLFPGTTAVHAAEVNANGIDEQDVTVNEESSNVDAYWTAIDTYYDALDAFQKKTDEFWEQYGKLIEEENPLSEAQWNEIYQAWKQLPKEGKEWESLKAAYIEAYKALELAYNTLTEEEKELPDDYNNTPKNEFTEIQGYYPEICNTEPIGLPESPYLQPYLDRLDAENGVYHLLGAAGDAMAAFDDANEAYQEELDKENPDSAALDSLYKAALEKYNQLIAADNALEKEYKALEALYQKIPDEERAIEYGDGNGVSIEWNGLSSEIADHRNNMKDKVKPTEPNTDSTIPEGPQTWKDKQGVAAFVYRLYNVALTRDGEEEGIADWTDRLNSKKENAAQVAWGFFFSDEFKNKNYSDAQFVEVLYRTMFGRSSDNSGKQDWISRLENGASREYVYYGFAESEEFSNLCNSFGVERGNVTLSQYRDQNIQATGFIARLYTKMLGRKFDEDGLEYWCKKYLTKENTIEEIASHGFLHSDELTNLNLSDTEFVTRMYETFLNREPEEAGLNDWVGRLERGEVTRDTLVFGFTNSAEFGNLKAEYNLP